MVLWSAHRPSPWSVYKLWLAWIVFHLVVLTWLHTPQIIPPGTVTSPDLWLRTLVTPNTCTVYGRKSFFFFKDIPYEWVMKALMQLYGRLLIQTRTKCFPAIVKVSQLYCFYPRILKVSATGGLKVQSKELETVQSLNQILYWHKTDDLGLVSLYASFFFFFCQDVFVLYPYNPVFKTPRVVFFMFY